MGASRKTDFERPTLAAVAERLVSARQARGWSAQKLSDRTAEIGSPITRNAIAKIEMARNAALEVLPRSFITVGELLVFARALDVPVAHLLPEASIEDEHLDAMTEVAATSSALGTALSKFHDALARLGRIEGGDIQ